jgi:arsenite methyltransferase
MSEQNVDVRQTVRSGYGAIAKGEGSCCSPSCCGGSTTEQQQELVERIGYSAEELAGLPEGANMGLSCGNPSAVAALQGGEVVVDLGSGGGFDAFIVGKKVGASGRVIGVDMTPEMLAKARKNIASYTKRTGLNNVEFRMGEIEHLPIADNSVDVVISNCVVNLSPDKAQVWKEIYRVLKPGGRVAISDLALLKPLPEPVLRKVEALIGCIAGAVLVDETDRMARAAGFENLRLEAKPTYVASMTEWNDPIYLEIIGHLPAGSQVSDYITSLNVTAVKPSKRTCC